MAFVRVVRYTATQEERMESSADMMVEDPQGNRLLVVRVRNRQGLDAQSAQQIAEHHAGAVAAWFMLASQEWTFIWRPRADGRPGTPDASIPLAGVVGRYEPRIRAGGRLRSEVLAMVLVEWLHGLCDGADEPDPAVARGLASVGLLPVLRGGRVRLGQPA